MSEQSRTVKVVTAEKRWHTNYYEVLVPAGLTDEQAEAEARRQVESGDVYPYDSKAGDTDEGSEEIEEITV